MSLLLTRAGVLCIINEPHFDHPSTMENTLKKLEERSKEVFYAKFDQLDFFVAEVMDAAPKSDRHSMEHPFFSLSKKKDTKIREYQHNDTTITITPSVIGLATIWDKDILLYCGSQITEALNKGEKVSRTVQAHSYSILTSTERGTGGNSYDQLTAALSRLEGTRIKTDIKTANFRETEGFGLIDSWRVAEKHPDTGRAVKIEITLSKWFFRALVNREVLTFNRDYFKLSSGLERRLYELARKHCGQQKNIWPIGLDTLHKKSGSTGLLKAFRNQIKKIAEKNTLPDYALRYDPVSDKVYFALRFLPIPEEK